MWKKGEKRYNLGMQITKNKLEIIKLTIAAVLTASAVAINSVYSYIVPIGMFRVPFFIVALAVVAIAFGPGYALITGVIYDLLFGFLNSLGYLPIYGFATHFWVLLYSIICFKRISKLTIFLATFFGYLGYTLINTFATWFYFGKLAFLSLILRLGLTLIFTPILFALICLLINRFSEIDKLNITKIEFLKTKELEY